MSNKCIVNNNIVLYNYIDIPGQVLQFANKLKTCHMWYYPWFDIWYIFGDNNIRVYRSS